jgi:hypothetical protein
MGFIEKLRESEAGHIFTFDGTVQEDGKPYQIRCRPMVTGDFLAITVGEFASIPIITGQKQADEASLEDRKAYYDYFKVIIKRCATLFRDVDKGVETWCNIEWHDGERDSMREGDVMYLKIADLERIQSDVVWVLGNQIINWANFGGDYESFKDDPFRRGGLHPVRGPGGKVRKVAPRGAAVQE